MPAAPAFVSATLAYGVVPRRLCRGGLESRLDELGAREQLGH